MTNVLRSKLALLAFLFGVAAAPSNAADMNKTLRYAFPVAETGFDPIVVSDLYSNTVIEGILDAMLTYDYLARPAKLVPNTLVAMPEVGDDGTTYVFHLKQGIYFTQDPAFNGNKRELTAQDYAYSIRRLFDPKLKSPWLFLLEGKIVGADAVMEKAKAANSRFDYDAPIAGLEVVDRYTLRIRLKEPDFNLLYIFAMPTMGAMAREVVERYGDDIGSHPVGTGAFVMKQWVRSSKLVLEANPDYREVYFNFAGSDPETQAIAAANKGKKLPIVGRVEISIIEEAQPRWLAFLNKEHDYLERLPNEFANIAIPGGKLAPNLAKQGMLLNKTEEPDVTYTYFNMEDPVVGGYSRDKIALRRAITLAYNTREEIQILRKNQAIPAQSPIPPGVAGYDPRFVNPFGDYNPSKAKALLDMFGYVDRNGDGYRELPNGKPLTLEYASTTTLIDRQFDELWKKSMDAVGIRVVFKKAKWPDLLKESKLGKLQIKGSAWHADYPDADNFLQLLYGPNSNQSNDARFKLAEFDRLYEKAKKLPDSPERTALYQDMTKLMLVYAPWKLGVHRLGANLIQPWVIGYKMHPTLHALWKYVDIDVARQKAAR
jgi:ABC-type transport system substrate-binding protein